MKTQNLLLLAGLGVAGYFVWRYYRPTTFTPAKGLLSASFDPQQNAWAVTGNVTNDKGQLETRLVMVPGVSNRPPSQAEMQAALLTSAPSQAATIEL